MLKNTPFILTKINLADIIVGGSDDRMKKLLDNKIFRIAVIALVVIIVLAFVSLSVYKRVSGIHTIEKYIDDMAEIMTPSQQDIQYVEENFAKLTPFQQKLVSNYDTYEAVYKVYTDELIDVFSTGEGYAQVYEVVMRKLAKNVNLPTIEVDKENRVVNVSLVTGPDTENMLMNDPERASEYLQTVMEDMIYVTAAGGEITSLYGMMMKAEVNTQEADGIKIMEVENGVVTSYILAEK